MFLSTYNSTAKASELCAALFWDLNRPQSNGYLQVYFPLQQARERALTGKSKKFTPLAQAKLSNQIPSCLSLKLALERKIEAIESTFSDKNSLAYKLRHHSQPFIEFTRFLIKELEIHIEQRSMTYEEWVNLSVRAGLAFSVPGITELRVLLANHQAKAPQALTESSNLIYLNQLLKRLNTRIEASYSQSPWHNIAEKFAQNGLELNLLPVFSSRRQEGKITRQLLAMGFNPLVLPQSYKIKTGQPLLSPYKQLIRQIIQGIEGNPLSTVARSNPLTDTWFSLPPKMSVANRLKDGANYILYLRYKLHRLPINYHLVSHALFNLYIQGQKSFFSPHSFERFLQDLSFTEFNQAKDPKWEVQEEAFESAKQVLIALTRPH